VTEETDGYSVTTLYIWGDDLDPGEITELLGIQPQISWRQGDRSFKVNRKGEITTEPTGLYHRRGMWKRRIDETKQSWKVSEQLVDWCDTLRQRGSRLKSLRDRGYDVSIDCYIDEGPIVLFELPLTLLERLVEFGIALSFGFYDEVGLSSEVKDGR
jgi:hypothetical protein